jgi:hypothetical protein
VASLATPVIAAIAVVALVAGRWPSRARPQGRGNADAAIASVDHNLRARHLWRFLAAQRILQLFYRPP